MRNIKIIVLLIVLVAYTAVSNAQSMGEFWDLNYYMTKDSVERVIKEKKASSTLLSKLNKEQIAVKYVVLDDEPFKYALFDFYQDKLLSGFFTQKEKENERASILFLRLRESLTEKYGEPKIETSDIITCYWHDNNRHIVQLSMEKRGKYYQIGILYLNGKLHSQKMLQEEQLQP